MPPLPPKLPERLKGHPIYPHLDSAYNFCVSLQEKIQEEIDSGEDATKNMIYCRVLGYLFHHPPTDQAIKTLVYEVVSAKEDEALLKIGEMYFNHLIRLCTSSKGFTRQILIGISSQI